MSERSGIEENGKQTRLTRVNGLTHDSRCIHSGFWPHSILANSLVSTALVSRAIREEPVDDHAANREQEYQQAPEDLVQDWARGLDDLDCC